MRARLVLGLVCGGDEAAQQEREVRQTRQKDKKKINSKGLFWGGGL